MLAPECHAERVPGHIADAIPGHGDKKKTLQQLYLSISGEELLAAIDMMKFDTGETKIRIRKSELAKIPAERFLNGGR